jgi:3',5'-cyclic AMP phosphodiesterase CpdA
MARAAQRLAPSQREANRAHNRADDRIPAQSDQALSRAARDRSGRRPTTWSSGGRTLTSAGEARALRRGCETHAQSSSSFCEDRIILMPSRALFRRLSQAGIRQHIIIHLSDIHFGSKHTFDPSASAAGDVPDERDYPTLLDKLAADLTEEDPGCPVLFALTGDMAQTGTYEELDRAETFVKELTHIPLLGTVHPLEDVFIVPGNHDVLFDSADIGKRWQQWTDFPNRLRGTHVDRTTPWDLDAVEDRVDDLGAVVVTINSSIKVQRGRIDQDRGLVEAKQIEVMAERLEAIEPDRLNSAIRVALIHHHPVLIPDLVEPGRGYDAVVNSAALLRILRRFGFHLLLHGHKHIRTYLRRTTTRPIAKVNRTQFS